MYIVVNGKNDLMNGKGVYYYSDGREYRGQWKDGYRNGTGIFSWPNGDTYKGQFEYDSCHGVGVHIYSDGKQYRGEWKGSEKQGYGVLSWPAGDSTEGFWENNLLCGVSVCTELDGTRVEEVWNTGARDGARKPLKRKANEMKKLIEETSTAVDWKPDSDFIQCYKCDESFGIINRKHHCRNCGLVFCDKCSSKRITLPHFKKQERVCEECFLFLKTSKISKEIEDICKKLESMGFQ